ncbi:MAG: hypothetical protein K6G12_06785 [Lachnospiraceae bacterium]|nr:hypothetical protein [Lachnospiraceae bacterium]
MSTYTDTLWMEENSYHSLSRAKERAGLNRKKAEKMINLARERGTGYEDCRWSIDRYFLLCRTNDVCLALAYNGFCFIFDRNTANCITMYPLPKDFGKKKTFYAKSNRRNIVHEMLQYA